MVSKRALIPGNLTALAPDRLAELSIGVGKGKPLARQRVRLELAGCEGTGELVGRYGSTSRQSARPPVCENTGISRMKSNSFARRVVEPIAEEDAAEALNLM